MRFLYLSEKDANAWAERRIRKACAGLRRDLVCTAVEIRRAIQIGKFTDRETECFAWTLSSVRGFQIHELYTKWRHSMYELARAVTMLWEGNHPLSRWLNLWGENPERALPEPDGLTPGTGKAQRLPMAQRSTGRKYTHPSA